MEKTNSILNYLSRDTWISTIQLCLNADIRHEHTFIVVEGQDDSSFFHGNISSNTYIIESFSGKDGVIRILKFFNKHKNIIGICDRDYEDTQSISQIFWYDHSCLEMMLIADDNVFESIVSEFYRGNITFSDLRNFILQSLLYLGYLRRFNYQKKLGINFSGFSMNNVIKNGKFSIKRAFRELLRINSAITLTQKEYMIQAINLCRQHHAPRFSYLDIIQGHDFIFLFHEICSSTLGNAHKASKESIEKALRCAYNSNHALKHTQLYSEIRKYEVETSCTFLREM